MEIKSGIYRIRNIVNEKMYIGQSINVDNRLKTHLRELREGSHLNFLLQSDFDKYKEENFIFEKIYTCEEEFLNTLEKYFIDKYNTTHNGYNIKNGNNTINAKFKNKTKSIIEDNSIKEKKLKEFENIESIDIEINKQNLQSFKVLKDLEYIVTDIDADIKEEYNLIEDAKKTIANISNVLYTSMITDIEFEIFNNMVTKMDKFSGAIYIDKANNDWRFLWGDSKDEYFIEFEYKNYKSPMAKTREIKINLLEK